VPPPDPGPAPAPAPRANCCVRAWRAMGPGADPWLLIASCLVSAVGAVVASPNPVKDQGLPLMIAGFGLIWSVGAPVADILSASLYSVYVSQRGGKQGAAMGAITSAGSLGRITFPLLFGFLSHFAAMVFSGALCLLSAAVLAAHYVRAARA